MRWRRSSNLDAAPENVKAISRPSNPNRAASAAAAPLERPSGSRARRAMPMRRPNSEKTSMPTNRHAIDSNAMTSRLILILPSLSLPSSIMPPPTEVNGEAYAAGQDPPDQHRQPESSGIYSDDLGCHLQPPLSHHQ